MGVVCLMTSIGCKLMSKDEHHVSDVKLNLISVVQLDDESFNGGFHNGVWKFSKGSLIVAYAQK